MIIWLFKYLFPLNSEIIFLSNIFFRSIISILTSFFITLFIGKYFIIWAKKTQFEQVIRDDGPFSHFDKCGTPTMGGIIIIISIITTVIMWISIFDLHVLCFFIVLLSYGIIGFFDDYKKIINKNTIGLSPKWKYFWQSIVALGISVFIYEINKNNSSIQLIIPFFKIIKLDFFYLIFSYFVIVGTSNAVNLTDGLDGLAIMPATLIAAIFAIIAYMSSNIQLIEYFNIIYLKNAEELIIICTAIVGSGLGFLWFNAYPAQIFMGDVGSLSIGGSLGTIALLIHQEFLLMIIGGLFVVETISVILQVGFFKLNKKRIFLMAPIHHHYELKGISEPLIIVRFWIISIILIFIGLAVLIRL